MLIVEVFKELKEKHEFNINKLMNSEVGEINLSRNIIKIFPTTKSKNKTYFSFQIFMEKEKCARIFEEFSVKLYEKHYMVKGLKCEEIINFYGSLSGYLIKGYIKKYSPHSVLKIFSNLKPSNYLKEI